MSIPIKGFQKLDKHLIGILELAVRRLSSWPQKILRYLFFCSLVPTVPLQTVLGLVRTRRLNWAPGVISDPFVDCNQGCTEGTYQLTSGRGGCGSGDLSATTSF